MEYPAFVYGQIYLVTNTKTYKQYVGQVRSHYRQRNGWVTAGYQLRWKAHLNEAKRSSKCESSMLNRSIRKHTADAFDIEIIHTCPVEELDMWEIHFIDVLDTFLYGYNLTPGGKCGQPLHCIRKRISNTITRNTDDTRLSLLDGKEISNVKINRIISGGMDIASLTIRTTDNQYIKVDFGGKLQSLVDSVNRATKFALIVTTEDKIIIQQSLQSLINLPNSQPDDRLAQNSSAHRKNIAKRYESLRYLQIDSIRIEKRTTQGKTLATLVIKVGTKYKFVNFGGKLVNFEDSLTNAKTLAMQLIGKDRIILQHGIELV